MNVWLVITNPYAYDQAMWRAASEAQESQRSLEVVFFISSSSVGNMIHELSEMGWLGPASLRNLQSSLTEGYQGLADDVLKRVERKVGDQVDVRITGVVKKPSLEQYIHRLLAEGALRVIVAGSKSLTPKPGSLPDIVEWIDEQ